MTEPPDFLQPTLRGPRITLRPMTDDDFEPLYAVASDPLLWEQHPEPTRYQRPVFERYFQSGMESKGCLVGMLNETGELVTCSRFYRWNPEERSVCIGYTFVARHLWGAGINREMKVLMVNHAFQRVSRVLFEVGTDNLRSRTAMERIGGVLSHEIPSGPGEKPHVVYVMATPMPENPAKA